jgi:transaldolase / glucose-6-phosphate isomerase
MNPLLNPVLALRDHGQAIWLDFLARGFIANGGLQKLVVDDGLRGVTSNPSIFEKAIGGSDEYDNAIRSQLQQGDCAVATLYERLAVEDIKAAADVLRPVYDATGGADGFVSIEVSPYLAMETEATIGEARRLWREIARDNLMIKVPATDAGLPAIQALVAEGINVNITLLFAQEVYEQVAEAFISGIEALATRGGDVARLASVASFFVSRIDTAVDKALDQKIAEADDQREKACLTALKGKAAIANAKLAYQRYLRIFAGPRWQSLAAKGARPQRLLWASTGTKNKSYSDVLYVEELIGRNTINTMPPATLDAFRHHGKARDTLESGIDDARRVLADLSDAGISLDAIAAELTRDGVRLFADAADSLLAALAKKRAEVLGRRLDAQTLRLGGDLESAVRRGAEEWRVRGSVRRLWARDRTLWTGADEGHWLGWLDSVAHAYQALRELSEFAEGVRREQFTDAVVLGMGGSSLGPEVLSQVFGKKAHWPRLRVLDSTDPMQIRASKSAIDVARTIFIISSKSGGTTEPNMLKDYFFARVVAAVGGERAGRHFVAITDPGTSLEKTAKAQGFRQIFYGVPSIGGRFSVLSPFGLVPAAVAGVDLKGLLDLAQAMVRSCGADVPPAQNPAVQLGLALGLAAGLGRDKVTLLCSPRVADFGAWAEQLIAESTGKNGRGLIPIDGEPLADPEAYGSDRFFIDLRIEDEIDARHDRALDAVEAAGHPVARIVLRSPEHIGQEFFRFELAIAVAGAVIGINPFDQPDVEASKIKTRELTAAFERSGALPRETPVAAGDCMEIYADAINGEALRRAGADGDVDSWLKAHFARLHEGDYAALLAYITRSAEYGHALQKIRLMVRQARHVATCVEFGPRFLHSTGQAYKGGPNTGVFLQLTADDGADLPIPGHVASFGVIKQAQARGDFEVLAERKRRALRVHLKGGLAEGLNELAAAIGRVLH